MEPGMNSAPKIDMLEDTKRVYGFSDADVAMIVQMEKDSKDEHGFDKQPGYSVTDAVLAKFKEQGRTVNSQGINNIQQLVATKKI